MTYLICTHLCIHTEQSSLIMRKDFDFTFYPMMSFWKMNLIKFYFMIKFFQWALAPCYVHYLDCIKGHRTSSSKSWCLHILFVGATMSAQHVLSPSSSCKFPTKIFWKWPTFQPNNYGIVRNEHDTTISAIVVLDGIYHLGRRV
jgi:hypothetical protein